jgi:hypothetical protein
MRIIITETQYHKLMESFSDEEEKAKRALFKIWQSELDSGEEIELDPKVLDYINYTPTSWKDIYTLYGDFLGGWDKMIEKTHQLMDDKTFDTMDYDGRGGYDFRFKVTSWAYTEREHNVIHVNYMIERDGEVTLMTDMRTHTLKELTNDKELWWEVESEIRSIIEDMMFQDITKKTGIFVHNEHIWIEE